MTSRRFWFEVRENALGVVLGATIVAIVFSPSVAGFLARAVPCVAYSWSTGASIDPETILAFHW